MTWPVLVMSLGIMAIEQAVALAAAYRRQRHHWTIHRLRTLDPSLVGKRTDRNAHEAQAAQVMRQAVPFYKAIAKRLSGHGRCNMHDGVTTSWRRLSADLRNYADSSDSDTRHAELVPLLAAQEEWQLDAWEDDGGMVAAPSKPVATLDLPEQIQMSLPLP